MIFLIKSIFLTTTEPNKLNVPNAIGLATVHKDSIWPFSAAHCSPNFFNGRQGQPTGLNKY
jgi:hypothetical protein